MALLDCHRQPNVFKTCHDAAGDEAGGRIKERRRSGKANTVAHEVHGTAPTATRSTPTPTAAQ
jgi:hypothetical protein